MLKGGVCAVGFLLVSFCKVSSTYPVETYVQNLIKEKILSACAPVFVYGTTSQDRENSSLLQKALLAGIPAFSYVKDGTDASSLDHTNGAKPLPVQDDATWQQLLSRENEAGRLQDDAFEKENEAAREAIESIEESAAATGASSVFIPHERQVICDLENYRDFSALFEAFYAMDSNTMIGTKQLNLDSLLEPEVTIRKEEPGPQILIYHTHSQEGFADSVPGDASTTIVGAGEKLARLLTEEYGYSVLHHTGEYDVATRDGAYNRSLPALEQILEEYPGIQVIIDLHRDGIASDRRLMVELDGRPTAQFMFFNGLSRTKNTGDIEYLYNPYQAQNLALSFRLQLAANEYYPGLARKIYLNGYRYNMHLRPSILIELGAQTNTVEEIMNAVDPLAHILNLVFSGQTAQ